MEEHIPKETDRKKQITPLPAKAQTKDGKLRVAAYCRVSTDRPEQEGSIKNQQNHFRKCFDGSDTEELVGVYQDQGFSGTRADRCPGLQQLLTDCRKGLIDRIVCKSISRFSRNLRDCLITLRELKSLGITISFEKENLDTAVISDEIMLTIMEGLAEEESASISRNTRWSLQRRMRNGTLSIARVPYGYQKDPNGALVIDEEKAAVIRRIFRLYLSGCGARRIAKTLNEELIPSPTGIKWGNVTILKILAQEKYTGDILWQKTWSRFMGPKWQINHGEADRFYIKDSHPAIIDRDTFQCVSELRSRINRSKSPPKKNLNPFRSKLICSCGRSFLLFRSTAGDYWKCGRATDLSAPCSAPGVRDADIRKAWEEIYGRLICAAREGSDDQARCASLEIQSDQAKCMTHEGPDDRLKYADPESADDQSNQATQENRDDRLKGTTLAEPDNQLNCTVRERSANHSKCVVRDESALQDMNPVINLRKEQESICRQRYALRKECLEEKITPSQLAEYEAALDQKLSRVNLSMKQKGYSEEKEAGAFSRLQEAILNLNEADFLREMLESVTLRNEGDEEETEAIFRLKGGVEYSETIRSLRKKHRHKESTFNTDKS